MKRKLFNFIRFLGLDYKRILSLKFLPYFIFQLLKFKRLGGKVNSIVPILEDYKAQAGNSKSPYFLIDSLVAREIYKNKPKSHFDVGSRIDGLVGQVSIFSKVDVADIRPLSVDKRLNFSFKQFDLMNSEAIAEMKGSYSSISSIHAIEHFGLGRYGDPLNLEGHLIGIKNICCLLSNKGKLYLGFPCGLDVIEFNSQRLLNPHKVMNELLKQQLQFDKAWHVGRNGALNEIFDSEDLKKIMDGTIALICSKHDKPS